MDKSWEKKISNKPAEDLESRGHIFIVQCTGKGHGKWKSSLMLERASDVEINTDTSHSNHINIYDIETYHYTIRDRWDIRLFSKTKVDQDLMLDVVRYANKLKRYLKTTQWHEETPYFKHH